eukprot:CAMPEP_0205926540 /NCGR_PEP_ID=MMETSP1325-20131115/20719_1 /ASSEMBLY_ACC=CAM_ASM_000708 /TAXON_ID=236786 /ORGANISM="Florenciella sp., Strain RCC1007" /LENGTH=97 /DNA_ID=CAMNT_0053295287 /DNA_START=232 /DNA_END=521 /DNA_ORIENTATION=+
MYHVHVLRRQQRCAGLALSVAIVSTSAAGATNNPSRARIFKLILRQHERYHERAQRDQACPGEECTAVGRLGVSIARVDQQGHTSSAQRADPTACAR